MRARLLQLSILTISTLVASGAAAQSYSLTTTPGSFSSIAATGTVLSFASADDGFASFSSPVSFPFFGDTVAAGTTLYATTNGMLALGTSTTEYSNTTIPSSAAPNRFLAPFWDDLTAQTGAQGFWQMSGTTLIVEWSQIVALDFTTESVSFQARIDTTTGVIRFVYGSRVGGASWSGTIGVESLTGTAGASVSCSPSCTLSDVPTGTNVVFTPSNMPPGSPDLTFDYVSSPPTTARGGDTVQIDFAVANIGTAPSAGYRVGLYLGSSPAVTTSDRLLDFTTFTALPPESIVEEVLIATIPTDVSGVRYLAVIADDAGAVAESNESNNVGLAGPIDITPPTTGQIVITTTSLPDGVVGTPYDFQLVQTGGTNPTWVISFGSLPSGLTMSTGGRITGTPTEAISEEFEVECDALDATAATRFFVLSVDAPSGIRLVSNTLPTASAGAAYSAQLEATGGFAPYAFQVLSGAPDGIVVDGMGAVSGTPTTPGAYTMMVSLFDSEGASAVAQVQLEVVAAGPLTLASTLPPAVTNRAYSTPLVTGGRPPYTVAFDPGALPPGFTIDSSGALAGQASAAGVYPFMVQVTDAASAMTSGSLSLTVEELAPLTLISTQISLTINTDNDVTVLARGGIAPYTWSLDAGTPMAGVSFDAQRGAFVGRPTMVATTTVTVSVTDSDGARASGEIILRARVVSTALDGGARRGSGCACTATEGSRGTTWLGALLLGGIFLRRSRRRTAHGCSLGSAWRAARRAMASTRRPPVLTARSDRSTRR